MLVYVAHGARDLAEEPVAIKARAAWEFWVVLSGNVTFTFEKRNYAVICEPSLLVFPPEFRFGCEGDGIVDRAVFDFNAVSPELDKLVPSRGYYVSRLSGSDLERIRLLARRAGPSIHSPTELSTLQHQAMQAELSLIALGEFRARPLRGKAKAQAYVDQALAYYATNMDESPGLVDVSRALNLSTAQVRRLFYEATGSGPKASFNAARMKRVEMLLTHSDSGLESIAGETGFSDASALSRAVKNHFGASPRELRRLRARYRDEGY